jgi:hypothetical protein
VALCLFSSGVWILFQPMEMRGMLPENGGMMAQSEITP